MCMYVIASFTGVATPSFLNWSNNHSIVVTIISCMLMVSAITQHMQEVCEYFEGILKIMNLLN